MSRSLWTRGLYALVALTMLLSTSLVSAQDGGLIKAPPAEDSSPATLNAPTDAQRIGSSPEAAQPETLDLDEPEIDDSLDNAGMQEGCGCESCGDCGDCDSCGCGCGCHAKRHDMFGCLRRMMATCAAHQQARCEGRYDTCLDRPMDCERGQRYDPNRTPAATGQLFQQYYTQGPGAIPAQMYVSPYPVPAAVGHTYITYQAFEPHQFLYRHKRAYTTNHGPNGGITQTRIYWW